MTVKQKIAVALYLVAAAIGAGSFWAYMTIGGDVIKSLPPEADARHWLVGQWILLGAVGFTIAARAGINGFMRLLDLFSDKSQKPGS